MDEIAKTQCKLVAGLLTTLATVLNGIEPGYEVTLRDYGIPEEVCDAIRKLQRKTNDFFEYAEAIQTVISKAERGEK